MNWLSAAQTHPLFAIAITVLAYVAAHAAWSRLDKPALLHPVLIATASVSATLLATGMSYKDYFAQAMPINEALGLVIVLLAVPLYRQFGLIRSAGAAIALGLVFGSALALFTALATPVVTGTGDAILATLAPKSVTAAVAVEISDRLGGIASLTAVVVISTGIFGAVFGPPLCRTFGITDDRAVGFAIGTASHAIGTARAFQISQTAGAFASLGMILNAMLTIAMVPLVLGLAAH